jgi:hypothetical protein
MDSRWVQQYDPGNKLHYLVAINVRSPSLEVRSLHYTTTSLASVRPQIQRVMNGTHLGIPARNGRRAA